MELVKDVVLVLVGVLSALYLASVLGERRADDKIRSAFYEACLLSSEQQGVGKEQAEWFCWSNVIRK